MPIAMRWMARPRADLPPPAAIRALADAQGRLGVRVTPGAREETLAIADGRVLAKVRAKPEDGKATAAVLALLAQALDVPVSRVTLVRGATAREKLVQI
jgi:uncharacterized protein